MTQLTKRRPNGVSNRLMVSPADALWRYAPSRDENHSPTSDLMMLLPGLKSASNQVRDVIQNQLQDVLESFDDRILFADLNLRLGILWVTVRSEVGLCAEVINAIRNRIEDARSVSHYISRPDNQLLNWKSYIPKRLR